MIRVAVRWIGPKARRYVLTGGRTIAIERISVMKTEKGLLTTMSEPLRNYMSHASEEMARTLFTRCEDIEGMTLGPSTIDVFFKREPSLLSITSCDSLIGTSLGVVSPAALGQTSDPNVVKIGSGSLIFKSPSRRVAEPVSSNSDPSVFGPFAPVVQAMQGSKAKRQNRVMAFVG